MHMKMNKYKRGISFKCECLSNDFVRLHRNKIIDSPDQNCYTLAILVHKANNSVLNLNETITHVMKLAYNCLTRNQSYKIALKLFERTILKLHV